MATYGPTPARDAERRRRNAPPHPIVKVGPDAAEQLPFRLNFAPEPPAAPDHWHPFVIDLWEGLLADPARLWMGTGAWATNFVMCENLSRMLLPRIAATIPAGEGGEAQVIREEIPLAGSELAGVIKWLEKVGIYEGDRLRIQKEITFHPAPKVDTEATDDIVADRRAAIRSVS